MLYSQGQLFQGQICYGRMVARITHTFNTGRFVCLPGTISFFCLSGNICVCHVVRFLSVYVLLSQGTLLYGQVFPGKMFARITRTFAERFFSHPVTHLLSHSGTQSFTSTQAPSPSLPTQAPSHSRPIQAASHPPPTQAATSCKYSRHLKMPDSFRTYFGWMDRLYVPD